MAKSDIFHSQELMMLIDNGLLSTQNAHTMTNMILGLDLKHAGGKVSEKFVASEQYITPSLQQKTMAQHAKS
jgi:hypothetical protein